MNTIKAMKEISIIRIASALKVVSHSNEKVNCSIWSDGNTDTYFSTCRYVKKHNPENMFRYERWLRAYSDTAKRDIKAAFSRKGNSYKAKTEGRRYQR